MKLRFAFLGLLSLIAVSCSYEETFVPEDNDDNSAVEFYATIDEQPDADTKVYADENLKVLWNADDRITIFNKNTYNQQYRFTGENGDNAGGFRIVKSDDEFVTSNPLDLIYAVYPYQESTKISNDGDAITYTLPSEQSYKENSFGIGANVMVAVADGSMLKFKNASGYLSLKFFGEGVSVSSIKLKSNNGESLSGPCTINTSSGTPVLSMKANAGSDEVTLVCDSPVALGATSSEATQFIFVLPPMTLSNGFTVTVTTPEGGVFEKSSTSKRVIARSSITRLGAMEMTPEYAQPNNVIYYTSSDSAIITPSNINAETFGANLVSNEYLDGRGVMTFDGPVTTIGYCSFAGCTTLTSITIPNSVTKIGEAAFFICSRLDAIVIPSSVTMIDGGFFSPGLATISVNPNNTVYDSRNDCNAVIERESNRLIAGCKNTIIPNSVTSIGNTAFCRCYGLTSIEIPRSVTSIGDRSFEACISLTSIKIPDSVTNIGYGAFNTNYRMSSIIVASGNQAYDSRNNCNAIIETKSNTLVAGCMNTIIPDSVTSIGDYAFTNCYFLTSINIPESVMVFGDYAFYGCNSLTSLYIPNSVTSIGEFAFYDCSGLVSINLPESVSSIGDLAFSGCSSLASLEIPNSITSLGFGVFRECTNLISISIPESMTSIGHHVFYGCNSLTSITVHAKTPPNGSYGMFDETNNCPIYVPGTSVQAYKSTKYWDDYADRIQAIEQFSDHMFVDLGLPSGTLWATCNIGANSPEEFGNYYGWGEVEPNSHYCWDYYRFGSNNSFSKYNSTDGLTQLDLEDDAAYVNWGNSWRMPTHEEECELVNNCTIESFTLNGVSGQKFIGPNGNYIFFPLGGLIDGTDYAEKDDEVVRIGEGGWYWSSTLDGIGSDYAEGICFWPSLMLGVIDHERCDGHMIRPVRRN